MYGLCSKLVSYLTQACVFVQAKRHLLTTKSVHFAVIYKSVMFYDTGTWPNDACKKLFVISLLNMTPVLIK